MRAVNGFLSLFLHILKNLIYRLTGKKEVRIEQQDQEKYEENQRISIDGTVLFTAVMVAFVVYGYVIEPEVMNKGMYNKIDMLFNM